MFLDLAVALANVRPTTHVVVSWQTISWPEREFGAFKTVFLREVKKAPPVAAGVLRELDYQEPNVPGVHNALVGITLRRWLPRLLPTTPGSRPPPSQDAPAHRPKGWRRRDRTRAGVRGRLRRRRRRRQSRSRTTVRAEEKLASSLSRAPPAAAISTCAAW